MAPYLVRIYKLKASLGVSEVIPNINSCSADSDVGVSGDTVHVTVSASSLRSPQQIPHVDYEVTKRAGPRERCCALVYCDGILTFCASDLGF